MYITCFYALFLAFELNLVVGGFIKLLSKFFEEYKNINQGVIYFKDCLREPLNDFMEDMILLRF